MEIQEIIKTITPIFVLALVAAGWMGVQLLAKKMKTKNHIDNGGCCGACSSKTSCTKG